MSDAAFVELRTKLTEANRTVRALRTDLAAQTATADQIRELKRQLKERDPNAEASKAVRQAEAKASNLEAKLKTAIARADAAEDLRDSCFGLMAEDFREFATRPLERTGQGHVHVPILFTSDFQYGEVIRPENMDWMNAFNRDIFIERYRLLIEKSIRWSDAIAEGWEATYPHGIIYLRGGDAVSGDIHEELCETNDASGQGAIRELAEIEWNGIQRLKQRFGKVHVISIPGNHGRTTRKIRYKQYTETNYETILAWLLQAKFESDPAITWEAPESGYSRFEAEGWRFEMRHGDRMGAGGGTGWIGAPAPISKGHKKIRLDAASVDAPVDIVLTGHLHTSMKLPRGFANGSMPGYNEFARALGLDPDAAKQWFLLAHKARVYGMEIECSHFPKRGYLADKPKRAKR